MKPTQLRTVRHMLDGSFWLFVAQLLIIPTGIATVAYLTRRLGPIDYGNYAVVLTIITSLEFCVTMTLGRTTVKFVSEAVDYRPVATTVMQLSFAIAIVTAAAVFALANVIAVALHEENLTKYLRLAAFDIPLFVLGHAHLQVLVGLGRFRHRALLVAVRWLARFALIVILVELGLAIEGAILACIGTSLLELAISRVFCHPPLLLGRRFPIRKLLSYAVPLFFSELSLQWFVPFSLLALKATGGTAEEVGFYAVALNALLLPGLITAANGPILLSTMSRMVSCGETAKARKIGRQVLRCSFLILPLVALVGGAASEVATLVFGDQFSSAGPLVAVMLLAGFSRLSVMLSRTVLVAAANPRWTLYATGPVAPVALIGFIVLIPWLGSMGAACATTFAFLLAAVTCLVAVHRAWQIAPAATTMIPCAALSGIAFYLASLWSTPGLLVLVKLPTIGLLIIVVLVLIGQIGREELALIRSSLRRPAETATST